MTDIVISTQPITPDPNTDLATRDEIFVFGSNEAGIHGAGAAKAAADHFGAIMKQGFGPMGKSFGIPTCSKPTNAFDRTWVITPEKIQYYVYCFILYAKMHPELDFKVTRLGTGYVGIKDEHMAPLFTEAPSNCSFDDKWKPFLPTTAKFWGDVLSMYLLLMLFFGHAVADFPMQNFFMAEGKNPLKAHPGIAWQQIMLAHCFIHMGFVLGFTQSVPLALAELVIHYVTDVAKSYHKIDFNTDQAIHYGCKCLWAFLVWKGLA